MTDHINPDCHLIIVDSIPTKNWAETATELDKLRIEAMCKQLVIKLKQQQEKNVK